MRQSTLKRHRAEAPRLVPTEAKEGERSEPDAASVGTSRVVGRVRPAPPDPEVLERPRRRRFSAKYKLRILREVEACTQRGEVGSILRREGLYSSHISKWRRQRKGGEFAGLQPKKRGPRKRPDSHLVKRVGELERENRRLRRQLKQAETILEIQKKASELLGISLRPLESDESD